MSVSPSNHLPLYPLKFVECIRRYGFGGRRIPEYFGKQLPDGVIAETWEITDHGEDVSIIRNGPLAGESLRDLVRDHGRAVLGTHEPRSAAGGFPLLIKFLDAQRTLGMQVHPDDDYAAANEPGENGKTEAWSVIEARPGAVLYCGNVPGLTREQLEAAIADGNPQRCMQAVPVAKGDTIYVPSGRMHAIGAGILVYEPQQSCNLTYGPFGRPNDDVEVTKLRVRKFVEACHLEDLGDQRIPPVTIGYGENQRSFLLASRFFAVERLTLRAPWHQSMTGDRFLATSVLSGSATLRHSLGEEQVRMGESFLAPAAMGDFVLEPTPGCELLTSWVPDLVEDVIGPLRAVGVPTAAIAALGGPGAANDVAPLLS